MVLQQCAHFYNNIATEMIPCQKPMMLAQAVEFEKVRWGWVATWLWLNQSDAAAPKTYLSTSLSAAGSIWLYVI